MLVKIYNLDLERFLLAGLLRHPQAFADVDSFISESDFVNNLHKTIFGVIRQTLRSKEKIEPVLVAQKINVLSLSFEDNINDVLGYLTDLSLIQINSTGVKDIADELKLYTIRREIAESTMNIAKEMSSLDPKTPREEILAKADLMYNEKISIWDNGSFEPENICGTLDAVLEDRINNPPDLGAYGPHPMVNRLYGSLFRPSNISVVCARAKAGKTSFLLDYAYQTSKLNKDIPVLYFDVGEMSSIELQMRLAANISGVPLAFIEKGTYRSDKEMFLAVDRARKEISSKKIYYYNVASKSVDEMLTILKRFYLSKVGRGNQMLFVKDYLKSFSEKSSANKSEWESFGIMVNKFKNILSSEVPVGMLTASQSNRSGIVTNKKVDDLIESEEVVGGSDRIVMYSSQVFLLRKKINEEILAENSKWGSHKLIPLVTRHLGDDVKRSVSLVKLAENKLRPNYINLDIDNFRVSEKGDLVSMVKALEKMDIISPSKDNVSLA